MTKQCGHKIVLASLALSACATTPHIDVCKYSAQRRVAYTTAISTADAYTATGKPAPQAVVLGREAAVLALGVLNANCPPS